VFASLALLALLAAAPTGAGPASFTLLDAGSYLQKDLAALPQARTRTWLALCQRGAGVELVDVTIDVRAFRSGAANDGPKQQSGREIVVPGCPEPLMLVRGPGLQAGKVPTVAHEEGKVAFAGAQYLVKRDQPEPEPEDPCGGKKRVHLQLSEGERRQSLVDADFCTIFTVRWSGDLDGDGKLDLLVVDNLDSGGNVLRLFLSKAATDGKTLVRQVAKVVHKP
jgi:hypothetical protein